MDPQLFVAYSGLRCWFSFEVTLALACAGKAHRSKTSSKTSFLIGSVELKKLLSYPDLPQKLLMSPLSHRVCLVSKQKVGSSTGAVAVAGRTGQVHTSRGTGL